MGSQAYGGTSLDGASFTAQLFGGPLHAASANLQPLSPLVTFRSGSSAGFIVPPPLTVTVPSVAEGQPAKIQLRAWNNQGGAISNWFQAVADPSIPRGDSWPFITPPLGGPFHAPPNLIGLESFNLATGAVQGFSLKINFQPDSSPVPSGYFADTGQPFGTQSNGFAYGWNFDHRAQVFDRNATNAPDPQHDTFLLMQSKPASVWEIALTNGVYAVHVAAGSPTEFNGRYQIEVEDQLAIDGAPSAPRRWLEGDLVVEVKDSRLTLSGGAGALNNRLCFVEIARIEPPRLTAKIQLSAEVQEVVLNFEGEPGFAYFIESSENLTEWQSLGLAVHQRGLHFQFKENSSDRASHRFYRVRTSLSAPLAL